MTTIKRTIELDASTDAALVKIASASGLSPSAFVESALAQLLSEGDDLAEEMRRWTAYEKDGKSVAAEDVDAWIDSLGTKTPLPKPQS
jgi:predicted transcriptional regulator